jgi:hypothetical protein
MHQMWHSLESQSRMRVEPVAVLQIRDFIPDPGYEFFLSRISDPHERIKVFSPQTLFFSSRTYDPGCSCRIRDLDHDFLLRIRNIDRYVRVTGLEKTRVFLKKPSPVGFFGFF